MINTLLAVLQTWCTETKNRTYKEKHTEQSHTAFGTSIGFILSVDGPNIETLLSKYNYMYHNV